MLFRSITKNAAKLFVIFFAVTQFCYATQTCKVTAITDGDTIKCLTEDKTLLKVRLDQIDAPEKKQPYGNAAKQHLADLIFQRTVTLDDKGHDRYKRIIAEVYLDGMNINKQMVADGYAWAFIKYVRDRDYYRLQATARKNKKGLWQDPNPIYPAEYRRNQRKKRDTAHLAQSDELYDLF